VADGPVSLLYVQTAHSGTFIEEDGNLILTLNDVSPITIFFFDKPNRIAGHELTQEFVDKWNEGDDSVEEDPTIAAIDILPGHESGDVLIVELMNPIYDGLIRTLQYDVIVLEEPSLGFAYYGDDVDDYIPESFGAVALFIDNVKTKDCTPGPDKDLKGCDLSGVNLSGVYLRYVDLSGANLRGANLSGANLSDANLIGANLVGANLIGVDLSNANLSNADLTDADFTFAKTLGCIGCP